MNGRILTIRALSAIHSGSGQGSGAIDQPVVRERITNWPCLNGESLKGVLRDACDGDEHGNPLEFEPTTEQPFFRAFGPPTAHASQFGGSLVISSGILLCFPLRSFFGTFAWVTSPLALLRWAEDHHSLGLAAAPLSAGFAPAEDQILVPEAGSALIGPEGVAQVYLEAYQLQPAPHAAVSELAGFIAGRVFPEGSARKARFSAQFGVIPDDLFNHLVARHTTNTAHIRLEKTSKTVAEGALWYEEDVPAETIFSAPVWIKSRPNLQPAELWKVVDQAVKDPIQIGGNRSVGRGVADFRFSEGETA